MAVEVQKSRSDGLTDADLQEITGALLPSGFVTPAVLIGTGDSGGRTSGTGTAGTTAGGTAKVGS